MASILSSIRRLPYQAKQLLLPCVDLFILVGTGLLAGHLFASAPDVDVIWLAVFAVIGVAFFKIFGVYRAVVSQSNAFAAFWKFLAGAGGCFVGYYFAIGSTIPSGGLSIILSVVFLVGVRLVAQARGGDRRKAGRRIAIYGAGAGGIQLDAAIGQSTSREVCFFIDDNESLHGRLVRGKPVLSPKDVEPAIVRHNVSEIVLAIPSLKAGQRQKLISRISALPVKIYTAPGLDEIFGGSGFPADYRPLRIDELLGRDPVSPIPVLLQGSVQDEVVLVTGAGGSIGSELCRQIYRTRPRKIVLFDISEHALYEIDRSLRSEMSKIEIVPLLGSICDSSLLERICLQHAVTVFFHAAAYKHVPMVEGNVTEAIKNNVFGTLTLTLAAEKCGAKKFVLVSTDKAVRPTNVMGASKRLCELILQARASLRNNPDITYCMVRFGNVLGSSGSVVPLFREQIQQGGPITLTHPDITRYFMSIPEAAQLVLQAATLATNGDLFVLDMGDPVAIKDLAYAMIRLSGLSVRDHNNPEGDIEIRITGLRPGEKMYEELLIGENPESTAHPKIRRARENYYPWEALEAGLNELRLAVANFDEGSIKIVLEKYVHGFCQCAGSEDIQTGTIESIKAGATPAPSLTLVGN
jgi:FlaA1/EpsC-like NDP-sugar epimerase